MQKTYNCFIVDDDEIDRLTTLSFIRRYSFIHIAGVFSSADAALQAARKQPPDILFLDIDMPGITGLELRRQLADIPACIFITSFPDYAVEGFEAAALDFLVKPLKSDRVRVSMERLQHFLEIHYKAEMLDYTLGGDTLFIKDGHGQVKLQLHEIIYLEALKDYTSIVTPAKKYCVLSTLGNLLENKAFQMFIRIHRSYAVQKHFVNRVTAKEVFINNLVLPVGRSYKDSLDFLKN
jgi:two-component system, LytTR family, response regulator